MKRMPCSRLEEGMMVVEDVYGRNGEVVVPAGAQITCKTIKLLEGWSIPSVMVEGEDDDLAKRFTPEQIAEVEKEINGKFVESALENPLIKDLIKLCVSRRIYQKFAAPAAKASS